MNVTHPLRVIVFALLMPAAPGAARAPDARPYASAESQDPPASGCAEAARHHRLPDPQQAERLRPTLRTPPTGDEIVNPGEFCRDRGVLIDWAEYVQSVLADIAEAIATDDTVYVVVQSASIEQQARSTLIGQGVNMDHVVFIMDTQSSPNPWIRDFGPFCIYEDGNLAITDFYYGFGSDIDDLPQVLAAYFGLPFYRTNVLHHGGNHISDGNGMGFGSTNIWEFNPGYTQAEIRDQFRQYLGIDSLIVVEPMQGDMTRHIDMFCKLLNDTLFVVGEYADPGQGYPGDYERLNNLADLLGSLHNLDGRPFSVVRIPMLPWQQSLNRTYTNSLILNDKVLVPTYEDPADAVALGIYAECMPDHEVIGIDSRMIIEYAGAIHCVTSCIHRRNPLVVFHQPLESLAAGETPAIGFSLNPGFANAQASVFYKPASATEYVEAPATWSAGKWWTTLPPAMEDFRYYLAGLATPGGHVMEVYLPAGAPLEAFEVEVTGTGGVAQAAFPHLRLECRPNPARGGAALHWELPSAGPVRLEVVDLTGRPVRGWLGSATAGRLAWDGSDDNGRPLPAGTYFLRAHHRGHMARRTIVLLP